MRAAFWLCVPLAFAACDGGSGAGGAGPTAEEPECTVSNTKLAGTTWLMAEAMPDNTVRNNPRARMKFVEEDGMLKVDYSVGSPYEVQRYECKVSGEEVNCREKPKLADWCRTLEVHQAGSCTATKLRELGAVDSTDAEINKAIGEARMQVEAAKKDTATWPQFQRANNFLGNKLQGLLDVRVRDKKCQLMVTDQYMTIFNGQRIVDSNPVGTNPFNLDKTGTWLFENCKEGTKFLALAQQTPPTDQELQSLDPKRQFASTDTIYYHYIGLKNLEAVEGCTYSADLWSQWKPKAQDVPINTMDCKVMVPDEKDPTKGKAVTKCVSWTSDHVWKDQVEELKFVADDESTPRAFYGMTRYKTCNGGAKEKLDTICASARVLVVD
jgi:hypothetical protein